MNSSVLKWPDRETVVGALKAWVSENASSHPELLRAGYFGSYAKGSWGVSGLPVPAELLIYTQEEWGRMKERDEPFLSSVEPGSNLYVQK